VNCYQQIGEERLVAAIKTFYERCFDDVMIGFMFFGHDINRIAAQQTDFVRGMLGGPPNYKGRSLEAAHRGLPLRPAHFARRLIILEEVLVAYDVPEECRTTWIELERALKDKIKPPLGSCQ
jgi:hemoglobin